MTGYVYSMNNADLQQPEIAKSGFAENVSAREKHWIIRSSQAMMKGTHPPPRLPLEGEGKKKDPRLSLGGEEEEISPPPLLRERRGRIPIC